MKKSLLPTLLFMFLSLGLFAQEGLKIGILVSPNIGFSSVTDSTKKKVAGITTPVRPGVGFGLSISYGFNETIGIQTGAFAVIKNLSFKSSILGVESKIQQRVISVEIPFGLKLRSPEIGDGIFVTGFIGGAGEFNVASTQKTFLNGTLIDTDNSYKNINPITVSPVFGLGVDWEFDWGMIHMGPSFHWGLMRVLNKKNNGNLNVKMSYLALDLGYYF